MDFYWLQNSFEETWFIPPIAFISKSEVMDLHHEHDSRMERLKFYVDNIVNTMKKKKRIEMSRLSSKLYIYIDKKQKEKKREKDEPLAME